MKYNQELPKSVEKKLDNYIDRIKKIDWFKPKSLDKTTVDHKISVALEAFGVKANIEYRLLKTESDWGAAWDAARDAAWGAAWDAARDAARDAAWDAARGAARGAAWDAARGAAWDAARDAAWDAAWDAARGAARGAADLLALQTPDKKYKEKYPNGNFLQLVDLWELGLYPVGVVDGTFICYVPDVPEANVLFDLSAAQIFIPGPGVPTKITIDGKDFNLTPVEDEE